MENKKDTTNNELEDKKKQETVYEDKFFEKGHLWLKLRTIILTILAWLGVIIPIYWTLTSTLLRNHVKVKAVWSYQEGIDTYFFLLKAFVFFFIGATVFTVIMTLRSNREIKENYSKNFTYDFDDMLKKRHELDDFYTARFGPSDKRINTKTYSVPEEKNISKAELQAVFKKEDSK